MPVFNVTKLSSVVARVRNFFIINELKEKIQIFSIFLGFYDLDSLVCKSCETNTHTHTHTRLHLTNNGSNKRELRKKFMNSQSTEKRK